MKLRMKLRRKNKTEQKIAELEFKLKALQNFVFNHHHNERGFARVYVKYPDGIKEEPLDGEPTI